MKENKFDQRNNKRSIFLKKKEIFVFFLKIEYDLFNEVPFLFPKSN